MTSFFNELQRRNVFRVAIAYVVTAWLVAQVLELLFDSFGTPDWVMKTILVLMAVGLVFTLVFAWAFELTPDGIRRESEVNPDASIRTDTGKKLDRTIIIVLVLAVGYFAWESRFAEKAVKGSGLITSESGALTDDSAGVIEPDPFTADHQSIAVLPFVNMSADPENEYFSDGLTETLLHMLAQMPELRVAARTSSFAFKGQTTSIAEIAGALNVAHILEGSVQKSGERVRVTAQLIRAEDGFHVWSQNYTRPLEDIFAIQDEIAGDVAQALGSSLLGGPAGAVTGVRTHNVSAYDSYLKGLEQQAIYSYGSLEIAENHFKQALARDPEFTDARLSLVRNYLLKNNTGLIDNDQTRVLVEPLIRQAHQQEPGNPLARALELTLELQVFDQTGSFEEARRFVDELRGLLHLVPTETYIRSQLAATLIGYFRNLQQAIEIIQAGLMIDPLAADLHRRLGLGLLELDQLGEARAALLRALELAPNNPNAYGALSHLEVAAGNLPAGLDWMRQATEVDPQDHEIAASIARGLYELELPEEGDRWFARVQALAPGSAVARNLAVMRHVARGDHQRATELAQQAISDQIGMRQGAFYSVLVSYVNLMQQAGRSREAYDFLVSVRPEIADFEQVVADFHAGLMRLVSFALLVEIDPPELRKSKWQQFTAQLDQLSIPWRAAPDDENHTWNHLLLGENELAIEHFVGHRLEQPLAFVMDRHKRPLRPLFEPVYDHPRVKAVLDAEAERYAELRIEVQEMLQQPEWQ